MGRDRPCKGVTRAWNDARVASSRHAHLTSHPARPAVAAVAAPSAPRLAASPPGPPPWTPRIGAIRGGSCRRCQLDPTWVWCADPRLYLRYRVRASWLTGCPWSRSPSPYPPTTVAATWVSLAAAAVAYRRRLGHHLIGPSCGSLSARHRRKAIPTYGQTLHHDTQRHRASLHWLVCMFAPSLACGLVCTQDAPGGWPSPPSVLPIALCPSRATCSWLRRLSSAPPPVRRRPPRPPCDLFSAAFQPIRVAPSPSAPRG